MNWSGETLLVTPIGAGKAGGRTLVPRRLLMRYPILPACRHGNIELENGDLLRELYHYDYGDISAIVACRPSGECRKRIVPEMTSGKWRRAYWEGILVVLGKFENMQEAEEKLERIVNKNATSFNALLYGVYITPILSFGLYFHLRRRERQVGFL